MSESGATLSLAVRWAIQEVDVLTIEFGEQDGGEPCKDCHTATDKRVLGRASRVRLRGRCVGASLVTVVVCYLRSSTLFRLSSGEGSNAVEFQFHRDPFPRLPRWCPVAGG